MPSVCLLWEELNFCSGFLATVLLLHTTLRTAITFIKEKPKGPHGKDTYCGLGVGKNWLKSRTDKTWPNAQFFHLWSAAHNGHTVPSLWGLRGTFGYLACVWHVIEIWQSFFYLNLWSGSPVSPKYLAPDSSVKERPLKEGSKPTFLILFVPYYLWVIPAPTLLVVITLQTESPTGDVSVVNSLFPLLFL